MRFNTYTESTANQIPTTQGLYAFYLDLVSPAKIGLAGRGPWNETQLARAKLSLSRKTRQQIEVLRSMRATGELWETQKRDHLAFRLVITGEEVPSFGILEEIAALPLMLVRDYALLVRQCSIMMQPVYVGITKEQSLYGRYNQHKRDHLLGNDAARFGVRLREFGIDWDDVIFACVQLERGQDNLDMLGVLERHFQLLARPALSLA